MSEFVDYLREVFESFGPIGTRAMFGGYGVYHDGVMFGLIADDVLYLKADEESAPAFIERGLAQFEFVKNGKPMKMSYYMAPEEIFDDEDEAKKWASMAYEAALRNQRSGSRTKDSKKT